MWWSLFLVLFAFTVGFGTHRIVALQKRLKASESSQSDRQLVKAIREGTLGVEDLRDAGFDKAVAKALSTTGPSPSKDRAIWTVPDGEEPTEADYFLMGFDMLMGAMNAPKSADDIVRQMAGDDLKWTPLPLPRNLDNMPITELIPGDEAWLKTDTIFYNEKGRLVVTDWAPCLPDPCDVRIIRIRQMRGGFELALPMGFSRPIPTHCKKDERSRQKALSPARVVYYANTKFAKGDPKGHWPSHLEIRNTATNVQASILKDRRGEGLYGRGGEAYDLPFYPEDK